LAYAQLCVASAKLLDKGAIHLEMDMTMLDLLRLIPPAHLGQHLGSLEAIGRACLYQTITGCVNNFCENPNEFVPR
jgi:hypothetical protein